MRTSFNQRGFALMMVLGAAMLFIVLAATTAYMVGRLQRMSAGQARYTAAVDAADAGIDLAIMEIANASDEGRDPIASQNVNIGNYNTNIAIVRLATVPLPSGSLEMCSAYEGIGTGAGSRGVAASYLINASAANVTGTEQGRLQSLRRKLVGGE